MRCNRICIPIHSHGNLTQKAYNYLKQFRRHNGTLRAYIYSVAS